MNVGVMLLIVLYFMVGTFVIVFTMNSVTQEGSISVMGIMGIVTFPAHALLGIIVMAIYMLCMYLSTTPVLSMRVDVPCAKSINDYFKQVELEKTYNKFGISMKDKDGNLRSKQEMFDELSEKWNKK